MRVSTDSVLLGAWVRPRATGTILDVGTGTGLLALMMAQKTNARIDAIEIDAPACNDARCNFDNSPWGERLTLINADFKTHQFHAPGTYDVIVSNPPFFVNSQKSTHQQEKTARHTDSLPHETLFERVNTLLSPHGRFCIILPFGIATAIKQMARLRDLHLRQQLTVKPTMGKPPNRALLEFTREDGWTEESSLSIRDASGNNYTDEYKEMTRDFYLAF